MDLPEYLVQPLVFLNLEATWFVQSFKGKALRWIECCVARLLKRMLDKIFK